MAEVTPPWFRRVHVFHSTSSACPVTGTARIDLGSGNHLEARQFGPLRRELTATDWLFKRRSGMLARVPGHARADRLRPRRCPFGITPESADQNSCVDHLLPTLRGVRVPSGRHNSPGREGCTADFHGLLPTESVQIKSHERHRLSSALVRGAWPRDYLRRCRLQPAPASPTRPDARSRSVPGLRSRLREWRGRAS